MSTGRRRRTRHASSVAAALPMVYWFLLTLLILSSVGRCDGTDVKWTGAPDDPSNPAHSAPRSQKYWDEHGIKRPEYGKTDAEVAAEQTYKGGAAKSLFLSLSLLVLLPALGYAAYTGRIPRPDYYGKDSHRLGSAGDGGEGAGGLSSWLAGLGVSGGGASGRMSPEEARRARLARFEAPPTADAPSKED